MSRRRKRLPSTPVLCTIESLSHEGRGVAHDAGKTLFVDGGLPGETVQARVISQKRKYDELVVDDFSLIASPSVNRVSPPCRHALVCGGCVLQHLDTGQQIAHKERVLAEHLRHFGRLQPDVMVPALTSEDLGYRTKARLGVRFVHKHDEILVGFRERHSNFITRMDQCEVLVPAVGKNIQELKALVRSLSVYQCVPQIEVSAGEGRCALIIRHMEPLTADDHGKLIAFSKHSGLEIFLQAKGPETVKKLWPEDGLELLSYNLSECDVKIEFHPTDFTQINPQINRKMIAQALNWLELKASDQVLDLFCGLGNFTLAMARQAASVTGVEGSQAMVERGYHNARVNRIANVEFFVADLHLVSAGLENLPWCKSYDKLLLDPPRSGAEQIVQAIDKFEVPEIVYVSCNPATLARDASILLEKGYSLKKAGVMDMFPHTSHVESMALFSR